MNRMRLILLAAALVAALLAAYLSMAILRRPAPQAPQPAPVQKSETVDVVVASRNIEAGEKLDSLAIQWRSWPREGLAADMISRETTPDALENLQDSRARGAILAGEPIVEARIVQKGEAGFLSSVLPAGMRAIAIPITELSAVSGFVLPNDRVDVILTRHVTGSQGEKVAASEAVLTNVKVLAINQTLGAGANGATLPDGRTAVLQLDPRQAEVLNKIVALGDLSLALRSVDDLGDGVPVLSDAFRNPRRAVSGPLVIRYGLERAAPSR